MTTKDEENIMRDIAQSIYTYTKKRLHDELPEVNIVIRSLFIFEYLVAYHLAIINVEADEPILQIMARCLDRIENMINQNVEIFKKEKEKNETHS